MFDFMKVGNHFRNICEIVGSMSQDDDRVYRSQIAHLSGDPSGANLSQVGLLKARLFGASFPILAFASRWPNREKERSEILTFAIVQCAQGLSVGEGPRALPRDFVQTVFGPSLGRQTQLIRSEVSEGPSTLERFTPAFHSLVEICHENLAESMPGRYGRSERERAQSLLVSGLFTRLNLFAQMTEGMR